MKITREDIRAISKSVNPLFEKLTDKFSKSIAANQLVVQPGTLTIEGPIPADEKFADATVKIRWCLKRVKVRSVEGAAYQKDVRILEYLENGNWIEVPEVDERFVGMQP